MKDINIIICLFVLVLVLGCGGKSVSDNKVTQIDRTRLRIGSIQQNDGELSLAYDSVGRLSIMKFTDLEKNVTDSVSIYYGSGEVIMKGLINSEKLSQKYKLNDKGLATKCQLEVGEGIEVEDFVETSFMYDASGYLIESRMIIRDKNRRETEQNFSFTIKNSNVAEIYNSFTDTRVYIEYINQKNVSGFYVIPDLWDSRVFLPAIYAGILGNLPLDMPKSAHMECGKDSSVINCKYDDYEFSPDGDIRGWKEIVVNGNCTDSLEVGVVLEEY